MPHSNVSFTWLQSHKPVTAEWQMRAGRGRRLLGRCHAHLWPVLALLSAAWPAIADDASRAAVPSLPEVTVVAPRSDTMIVYGAGKREAV